MVGYYKCPGCGIPYKVYDQGLLNHDSAPNCVIYRIFKGENVSDEEKSNWKTKRLVIAELKLDEEFTIKWLDGEKSFDELAKELSFVVNPRDIERLNKIMIDYNTNGIEYDWNTVDW